MKMLRINPIPVITLVVLVQALFPSCSMHPALEKKDTAEVPGVAVLLVDTDHPISSVNKNIYGQFLEHINHSVVDGLYAEQIRGQGFEGNDFKDYWKKIGSGVVDVADIPFRNGLKSIRLKPNGDSAGLQQDRLYMQEGVSYNGSAWIKSDSGKPSLTLTVKDQKGNAITRSPLRYQDTGWNEVSFSFTSQKTDTSAVLELTATGPGTLLVDFVSLMTANARANGKLRPDLFESLKDLKPTFIRWPGGSFASDYKWQDGIGPAVSRVYHPNELWGGYSDYYGFGTDEFLDMCRRLETDPMMVLPAKSTKPEEVNYAMNWVHYLLDPSTTAWGKMRAANGHELPYEIPYFQIDNEPMNHGLSANQYAGIVNVYGSKLREIAPHARIVACGQKRSNDLNWSQTVIDVAGDNFDILGCHNYEYENENYQTGVQRISDYLVKLDHFIQNSKHPDIKIAVLEWSLCRTYDWRSGLHTAGSLIAYERLSPQLEMTCPALLMRNTTDNPEWRAFIYHDHVSWFPGSGYVVEKLFRDHFAGTQLASASGTYKDIEKRTTFFDDIPQMKPEDWTPGTVDALATISDDGKHIIIKAVNYAGTDNSLLVRLQGSKLPGTGTIKTFTINAGLMDEPSMSNTNVLQPKEAMIPYAKDLSINMQPYSVMVMEISL